MGINASENRIVLRLWSNDTEIEKPRSGSFDIVRKNWLVCWNSCKNNVRGANKSWIIYKTSQNIRYNIIWSCNWVTACATASDHPVDG